MTAPTSRGAAALFQHVVAVDVVLGRAWDAAKKMMRKGIKLAAPKVRCQYCGFKGCIGHGARKNVRAPPRQRHMCKRCGRTFSGTPGFKGRHYSSKAIARALREYVSGLSAQNVAYVLDGDGIKVHRSTVQRWIEEYSSLLWGFSLAIRPFVGYRWHCDEVFFKILGASRWLFAVMDSRTRFILAWDVSDTKMAYKPLPLFMAARKLAGVVPWVFVTDGLQAFQGAAIKAFKKAGGFRLVHVRDIHLKNKFNSNNVYERLNGEIVARTKTARGFNLAHDPERDRLLGGGCPALVRMCVVHHNFFRPHSGLGGKTPAEAAGISIGGEDKHITMIWNAAVRAKADAKAGAA